MRKDTRISCLENREPLALWGAGRAGGGGGWKRAGEISSMSFALSQKNLPKKRTNPKPKSTVQTVSCLSKGSCPCPRSYHLLSSNKVWCFGFNCHFKIGALARKGSFPTVPGHGAAEQPKPPSCTVSFQGLLYLGTSRAAVSRPIIIMRWHKNIGHMLKLEVGQAAIWSC